MAEVREVPVACCRVRSRFEMTDEVGEEYLCVDCEQVVRDHAWEFIWAIPVTYEDWPRPLCASHLRMREIEVAVEIGEATRKRRDLLRFEAYFAARWSRCPVR